MADRRTRLSRLLSRRLDRVLPRLGSLDRYVEGPGARRVAAAARLGMIDRGVLRAWLRGVGPIRDELGEAEASAFSELVVAAAEQDPQVARVVAFTLPDHLARVPRERRGRYLKLLRAVCQDGPAALPLIIRTLPELLGRIGDDEALARYLARGMELHGSSPSKAESFLRLESSEGQARESELQAGLDLASVRRTLTMYARAHCGERVQVRPGERGAFTDGRHVYLPERIDIFDDERDYLVYRVLTARNVGYLEFGTLDVDLDADDFGREWPARQDGELEVERLLRGFPNSSLARDLFGVFEGLRVEARVREEYPGIARDMDRLADAWRAPRPDPAELAPASQAVEVLARVALGLEVPAVPDAAAAAAAEAAAVVIDALRLPDATVADTVRAMLSSYPHLDALLRKVDDDQLQRLDDPARQPSGSEGQGDGQPERDLGLDPSQGGEGQERSRNPNADPTEDLEYQSAARDPFGGELRTDELSDEDRSTEEKAEALLRAMRSEDPATSRAEARRRANEDGTTYEEMADFLDRLQAPAGPARDTPGEPSVEEDMTGSSARRSGALDADTQRRARTWIYPEWDVSIEDFKPSWVRLTEYDLVPGTGDFVESVRREHGPLIGRIRRSFEALRPDEMRRRRNLEDGDEIDIDRAIQERIEQRAGGSPSGRVYIRHRRQERDVSVAFLVDMSSSTNEVANPDGKRIIDVEKEALVLVSEALEAIGDRFAIWGFSGYGRDQVAFYVAKDFDDAWDTNSMERLGRMSWKMENRDGAAIRHATHKLAAQPAKVKLLLLLSDGKPLDCGCDQYSDRYAHEDTRIALREARQQGIHPFCITVDPLGQHYLKQMYGEVGYTVIDRVEALPQRLPMIYRRLTR